MIGLIVAALMAEPVQNTPAGPVIVARPNWEQGVKIEVPDEIGAALVPYMKCQSEYANRRAIAQMSGTKDSPAAQMTGADILAACASVRAKAVAQAEEMLATQGTRSAAERKALIDDSLGRLDAFILDPDGEASKIRKKAAQ